MAKPADMEKETWGTWEELLLACAVNRHGTDSWDSVAMEIQNRSSSLLHLLTPQNCKRKYHDLKRRFMAKDDKINDSEEKSENNVEKDKIPWLDELRKLRVAELRREVQQYDVSIVSLQLKVKRLKEEREESLKEDKNEEEKPDLMKELEKERSEVDMDKADEETKKSSSEHVAGKHGSGEDSDRDNQSFNESNSTDPKGENLETEEREKKTEPAQTGQAKVEPVTGDSEPVPGDSKPVCEGSFNGSSDSIVKGSAVPQKGKSSEVMPASGAGDSPELWESVAESKGGEEGTKENSDVQSSASLSNKTRLKKPISGNTSGDDPENDEVSPAVKRISEKPQPLIDFLATIRSHKYGSIFENRLESQETTNYRSLVRQHIDLEKVRTRLEEGKYLFIRKFFRDLMLLFNNATVFFPKDSVESTAALELREIVKKEMASRNWKPDPPLKEQTPPLLIPSRPKPDPEPSDSLLVKPNSSGYIFACRKRSSIERKQERKEPVFDEKPVPDRKQLDNFSVDAVKEQSITKKRRKDRSGSGSRSSKTTTKSRVESNSTANLNQKSTNPNLNPNFGNQRAETNEKSEPKSEKKNEVIAVAKKRSVANFLNRMKRNSSSNGTLLETLKSSVNVNNSNSSSKRSGNGGEQKKNSGKSDGRKNQAPTPGSSEKQRQIQSSPAKRSVGRPPKKTMERPLLPPPPQGKRTRDSVETEGTGSKQPRKRGKR